MPVYSRYFHSDLPSGSRVTCIWGTCFYPIGGYWGYTLHRRITLTLTSVSGHIDNMSMYAWTGTLPGVTPVTAENYLSLGSSPAVGAHATADFPIGTDGFTIEIKAPDSAYPLDVRVDFDLVPGDTDYCPYGTEVSPGVPKIVLLAPDILLAIVGAVTDGWAWAIAGLFAGQYLNVETLCQTTRPDAPSFTWQEIAALIPAPGAAPSLALQAKANQWLHWAAWGLYCQCIPGAGTVLPPPNVVQPPPLGAPSGPTTGFQCDESNLCRQMENLTLGLNALLTRCNTILDMVTLIQRQGVPFGYIPGTVHAGLFNEGDFVVADIIGLAVEYTSLPAGYPPLSGDPITYHQIGKISVGTADGWERSWMPTHNPYLILPISGAVTRVGYFFPSGIIATITELVREP